MKVSVTTPSFNQCAYLAETIESVVSQEGDFDLEYFVMDGGSTDGSVELIRAWADRRRRGDIPLRCKSLAFDWLSRPDGGQSDAINQGLVRSTGDVAAYINSDDRYLPGALASIVQAFAANPSADFIYGDGNVIDEQGATKWEWLSRPYDQRVMTSYHFLWNDFTNYLMQQAVFWRREVIAKIGLLDQDFHYAMDVEYWLRAGAAGLMLRHIPVKLAEFRLIEGTKSLSGPMVFWSDYLEIFRRYRTDSLAKFFAYYFYNLALNYDLSLAGLEQSDPDVLKRWDGLSDTEGKRIKRDARRGLALAHCLIALELQRRGRRRESREALRRISSHRSATIRAGTLLYHVKNALGARGASAMDSLWDRFVQIYRRRKVDYRYHS